MRTVILVCVCCCCADLLAGDKAANRLGRSVMIYRLKNITAERAASILQRKLRQSSRDSSTTVFPDKGTDTLLVVTSLKLAQEIRFEVRGIDFGELVERVGPIPGFWSPSPEAFTSQFDLSKAVDHWLSDASVKRMNDEEVRILESLQKPVAWHFKDVSLRAVLRRIATRYDFNIVIDNKGLKESGTLLTTRIRHKAEGVPLRVAMCQMLSLLKLGYKIEDEVLHVTSQRRLENAIVLRLHPVADIVSAVKNGKATVDFDSVIERIQTDALPQSWEVNGGKCEVARVERRLGLAIRQTRSGHRAVEGVLNKIRRRRAKEFGLPVQPD